MSLLQIQKFYQKIILSQILREYVYSVLLLNLAVMVWSLLIWSFAVRNPRNIKMRDAFICAAIPTVIFDSYQLLSLTRVL